MEQWMDISEYEGLYQISNTGRIRSLSRKLNGVLGGHYTTPERILNPPLYSKGYRVTKLYIDGVARRFGVHILVARAFIPNPDNKPCVNHIDGNKQNNHVSNLEWVTHHENHIHASKIGLKAKGESHGFSRLTDKQVIDIKRRLKGGEPQRNIAAFFGVCQATIKDINRGNTWAHVVV